MPDPITNGRERSMTKITRAAAAAALVLALALSLGGCGQTAKKASQDGETADRKSVV